MTKKIKTIFIVLAIVFSATLFQGCTTMKKWAYSGAFLSEPYVGMLEVELREVSPLMYRVNTTTLEGRIVQQYVYDQYESRPRVYIYVEDGQVVAIQRFGR